MGRHLLTLILTVAATCTVASISAQTVTDFDYFGAKLQKKEAGVEEYVKPNGTIIYKYPDREKAVLKSGTIIEKYPNGRREITNLDGSGLVIDFDGTRHYRKADGTVRTISLDGKTPWGDPISPSETVISQGGGRVVLIFDPLLSDDHLDGPARKFYNELTAAIKARIALIKPADGYEGRVVISQCRFAKTGHCRRKNVRELEVRLTSGVRELGSLRLSYESMLKDDERKDFVLGVAELLK